MCCVFISYSIAAITMSRSDRKHVYQLYSKTSGERSKKTRNASSSRDTQHRLEMSVSDRTSQGLVSHTLSFYCFLTDGLLGSPSHIMLASIVITLKVN